MVKGATKIKLNWISLPVNICRSYIVIEVMLWVLDKVFMFEFSFGSVTD